MLSDMDNVMVETIIGRPEGVNLLSPCNITLNDLSLMDASISLFRSSWTRFETTVVKPVILILLS